MGKWRSALRVLPALAGLGAAGCALLTPLPRPSSLAERLAAIPRGGAPVDGPVTIHWNEHAIPFVEAGSDSDAAFGLGLVHAHLRLGQMEIFRRVARGRISEMGGPFAAEIDHALRILDFGRAAAEIEAGLPEATRAWLDGFVAGINHYQRNAAELPAEFALLGMGREPWTVRDVLTCGRLAGTDVNWLVWFGALALRGRPDWPEIWARLVESGSASLPSFDAGQETASLAGLLAGIGRTGSNALALAPQRTAAGAAVMASDPHLGIFVPNTWLIAGLRSPSYHAVGLMAPGLPIFAIGRNPWIAWSGTNMRAASSDLVDLSGLPNSALRNRAERIRVRWWFDETVTIRESDWGPVLSDAPQLRGRAGPRFALRWAGHRASDEITAMLRVSAARDFASFKAAFAGFAVPGQNMLYAGADGDIGQVSAAALPARAGPPSDIVVPRAESDAHWAALVGAAALPSVRNPGTGFLVSANNRPARAPVPLGFFFSPDDRTARMTALIEERGKLSVDDVKALQRDVAMPSSLRLRRLYLGLLEEHGIDRAAPKRAAVVAALRGWDGAHAADSPGAAAFESFHNAFVPAFYAALLGEGEAAAAYARFGRIRSLIAEDLVRLDRARLRAVLDAALAAAAQAAAAHPRWGDMHRLALRHPLSLAPLVGGRFAFGDFPAAGGVQTVMKTAHDTGVGRHRVNYGSNARFVADMGDPDRSWFVLLGGQDGWFGSGAFLDQLPLWREGRYVTLPLRMETVRARFPHRTRLGG